MRQAISSEQAFEENLKANLIASNCAAYNQIVSDSITYSPFYALAEQSSQLTETEFTLEMTITLDGVVGNPNNPECNKIFQDTIVAAYAEANPGSDVQLKSMTIEEITPGFATTLRSGTTGTYTYGGNGSYTCK